MRKDLFSTFLDRSRLDRLDYELALIALDLLKAYVNDDNQVHQAFLDAGFAFYQKQIWRRDAYNDLILAETERLLRLARTDEEAWNPGPGPVEQQIAAALGKEQAAIEEIEAEIVALATRFEDLGYKPIEIGRALATVGLTFAPIGFIEFENWVTNRLQDGRAERERAFLDECLGEDRYPANKKSRH